jgi:hypothetical protein
MERSMGLTFTTTKDDCFYFEKTKTMSEQDYRRWKITEKKYLEVGKLTLYEDVRKTVLESTFKQFLPQIEPKFRAVTRGGMYSVNWYNYCVNTQQYLEREKSDRYE